MGRRIQQNPRTWELKKVGQRPLLQVERQPRDVGKRRRVLKSKKPNLGCVGYYHARGYVDRKWRRS